MLRPRAGRMGEEAQGGGPGERGPGRKTGKEGAEVMEEEKEAHGEGR